MTIDAYPLTWPYPQPRTEPQRRQPARFQVNTSDALNDLRLELDRLRTRHVVISSCVPVRRDGLPYTYTREPADPGVAVYFDRWVVARDDERTPCARRGQVAAKSVSP
jgi:hypothetical protein